MFMPLAVWGVSMKSGRWALAALVLLVPALGISACGGGSGESDEEQVEAAIETAFTSTAPAACGESRTIAFMEKTGESTGAEAERECEEVVASREGLPSSVTVSKVEVEDGEATAEVAFEGGDGDGLVVNVALVEDDGSWKIDDVTGLARLDRDRLTARIEGAFEKEGLGEPEIRCLVAGMDKLPQDEFEEVALNGDHETITAISRRCEAKLEAAREAAEEERQFERETEQEEREIEEEELAEIEAEQLAPYPRAVQQNFLKTCLATSGSNFDACECSLEVLESNYSVKELIQAEANIASGSLREMVESAFTTCV
jgi:hypothetical protein